MNVIRAKLCRLAKGQGHQSQLLPSWCLWQRLSECTHKHTTKYDTHAHMGGRGGVGEGWCHQQGCVVAKQNNKSATRETRGRTWNLKPFLTNVSMCSMMISSSPAVTSRGMGLSVRL
mgnify:CR=1 FL=1